MTNSPKSSPGCILAATFVALAMLGTPAYFLWRQISGKNDYQAAASELDVNVRRAKELGVPLEAKDLAPNPPVADSQNAAFLYNRAIGALPPGPVSAFDIQVAAENGN